MVWEREGGVKRKGCVKKMRYSGGKRNWEKEKRGVGRRREGLGEWEWKVGVRYRG